MFPHRWGMQNYVVGNWQVEHMPTKNFFMDSVDWEEFPVRTLRYLQITCNPGLYEFPAGVTKPKFDLYIDGLELVGPRGVTRLIDRFDSADSTWGPNTRYSSDERAPRGISPGSM